MNNKEMLVGKTDMELAKVIANKCSVCAFAKRCTKKCTLGIYKWLKKKYVEVKNGDGKQD